MIKFYRIFLLLIVLIFSTTFVSKEHNLTSKNNNLFKILDIEILNNHLIKKDIIKEKLAEIYNKNIFFISREDIEKPLKQINFFKSIDVKKKYPNTIIIKVFETKPVAIFYKKSNKYLLDSSSKLIKFEDNNKFKKLPNIFGEEADIKFVNFISNLKKNNFPTDKIKSYYYFKIGRWDLHLIGGKIIKLPYLNVDNAIRKSLELLERKDFQNYKIIDLRVQDKIIVE
jgi:cell division septal protein FtsQ